MIGTFKANNPYNNFLLLIYGFLLKLPMFLSPTVPHAQQLDGMLYREILAWLAPAGNNLPSLYSWIAFFLLYAQAISFNRLLVDQRLFPKTNYLAGMSYMLITSLFREWYVLSAPLIINTLLIWVLARLSNLYNNPNAKTSLFNIGMLTGIATLFYFPSIAFSILIIVGLIITRPFKLPEWLITVIGMITPYYFLGSWLFLANHWDKFRLPAVAVTLPKFHETAWAYTGIILILILVAIGAIFVQNNMRKLVVQSRKGWNLIYLYLVVAFFVPFLNASHSFDYWILAAIPASGFAAAAFLFPERKWFALFFHWSLVALSVAMGYFIK